MVEHNMSWHNALLQDRHGIVVVELLKRLAGAQSSEQRAALRNEVSNEFLQVFRNGQRLAVILDMVFTTENEGEYANQVDSSEACRMLRHLSDEELRKDNSRKEGDQRTACYTTVKRWGRNFLDFAARHEWFDKFDSGNLHFWRDARTACNRVGDWEVARSMLNEIRLEHHIRQKDWEVAAAGSLKMTRGTDLGKIRPGAPSLRTMVGNYTLDFDQFGDIDYRNWPQINLAAITPHPVTLALSTGSSPLSSPLSTIATPVAEKPRKNNLRARKTAASKSTLGRSPKLIAKSKPRRTRTLTPTLTEGLVSPDPADFDSVYVTLEDRPEAKAFLQSSSEVERERHIERLKIARNLLNETFEKMQKTLDEVSSTTSAQTMRNRDELFEFALSSLNSPGLALEWNSNVEGRLRDQADVWVLNDSEAMELVTTQRFIDKPLVIRGPQHYEHAGRASWFFQSLIDEYGPKHAIDVQDNKKNVPRKRPLGKLRAAILKPLSEFGSRDFEPLNCLKVPLVTCQEGEPPFMTHPRYQVGSKILGILEGQEKKYRLLAHSHRFNVFSTVATVSKFHMDIFNCTWVRCLTGVKAWFFLKPDADGGDRNKPDPKNLRVIMLFPGDVLLMPAGLAMSHAVITLRGPCLMAGGQRLDKRCLEKQFEQIDRMMRNPDTTNEDLSQDEFSEILKTVLSMTEGDPTAFGEAEDLERSINNILCELHEDA